MPDTIYCCESCAELAKKLKELEARYEDKCSDCEPLDDADHAQAAAEKRAETAEAEVKELKEDVRVAGVAGEKASVYISELENKVVFVKETASMDAETARTALVGVKALEALQCVHEMKYGGPCPMATRFKSMSIWKSEHEDAVRVLENAGMNAPVPEAIENLIAENARLRAEHSPADGK